MFCSRNACKFKHIHAVAIPRRTVSKMFRSSRNPNERFTYHDEIKILRFLLVLHTNTAVQKSIANDPQSTAQLTTSLLFFNRRASEL